MHDLRNLINLLIDSKLMKSTCFMCFKQCDKTMDIYENLHIENQWFASAISVKALMEYIFPMQEIILSQACHLCVDVLISAYIKLRRKKYMEKCLNLLIDKIDKELFSTIILNKKLYIDTRLTCSKRTNKNNVDTVNKHNHCEDFDENTHENEVMESCPICSKIFMKKQLKLHLRQHKRKKRKPYSCDLCDYRTKCKTALEGHINNKHLQQRPHHCSRCGKNFYTKSALSEHRKTHEHKKSIICEICGDSFYHNKSLVDHLKLHSDDKTFECDVCNHRFVNRSRVNNHMKQKHGEKKEFCGICGKRFAFKKDMRRHMKLVHKQLESNTIGLIHANVGVCDTT